MVSSLCSVMLVALVGVLFYCCFNNIGGSSKSGVVKDIKGYNSETGVCLLLCDQHYESHS